MADDNDQFQAPAVAVGDVVLFVLERHVKAGVPAIVEGFSGRLAKLILLTGRTVDHRSGIRHEDDPIEHRGDAEGFWRLTESESRRRALLEGFEAKASPANGPSKRR